MKKYQYTRTETIEISVPDNINNEEAFLDWISDHPDSRSADFQVSDTFIGEAHEIKET